MSRALDALAERAKAGEQEALEGLVRGLQDPLYRLALRFVGDPEGARDATQEVLILVVTQLSTFRGESAVTTWAYRVASRHLLRQKKRARRTRFATIEAQLGQPANAIEPALLASVEERYLEEELFLSCTQAMLRALDAEQRIAFILGAILELDAHEAAAVLEISEPTFRKRLSRARRALDAFVSKSCGVANERAPCRCRFQVNHAHRQGRLDPGHLRYAAAGSSTSLEALRAAGELARVKRSLELYRAQPAFPAPPTFVARLRETLERARTLSLS